MAPFPKGKNEAPFPRAKTLGPRPHRPQGTSAKCALAQGCPQAKAGLRVFSTVSCLMPGASLTRSTHGLGPLYFCRPDALTTVPLPQHQARAPGRQTPDACLRPGTQPSWAGPAAEGRGGHRTHTGAPPSMCSGDPRHWRGRAGRTQPPPKENIPIFIKNIQTLHAVSCSLRHWVLKQQ